LSNGSRLRLVAALLVFCAPAAGIAQRSGQDGIRCDRACLTGLVDRYFAALVAHDPRILPFSRLYRFVENATPLRIGEGLWQTATDLPGTFSIVVPDEVAGQVGFLGVMGENGAPVLVALRLKLENGEISEAEHLIVRELTEEALANLVQPRPGLLSFVPPAQRVSRQAMLEMGQAYYVALNGNDGSAAPFADDCERHENGRPTTGNPRPPPDQPIGLSYFGSLDCDTQLDTRVMSYISAIDARRVEIADVETGLVFGLSHFRQPMRERTIEIVGVPEAKTLEVDFDPFDLPAAHIFKIHDAEIHEIEAMGVVLPYDSRTGWE
jgi:hypothetical protein